jgi:signal transduction histidine kinase
VAGWKSLRPTWIESVVGALLLCLSLLEMFFSDEQPAPDLVRVVAAVVPPVLVAFSRSAPVVAVGGMIGVLLLQSIEPNESGTLGTGFSWFAISFAAGAWIARPRFWLVALVLSVVVNDARTIGYDLTDLLIDLAFLAFAFSVGRVVHRRTAQAESLSSRLELADADRERRMQEAVTRERGVIARELHDIVAHAVSLMVVQAGTARPRAERIDPELAEVLQNVEESGRAALVELRRLLGVLRSDDRTDLRPVPDLAGLDELLDSVRRAGLEVRATLDVPDDLPAGVALCAYRVIQEGLTNAMRYAGGSPVDVTVTGGQQLALRIQDHGGAPVATEPLGTGTGLIGLRERVLLCGGHLASGPSGPGHLLEVTLPLSEQEPLPEAGRS